MTVKKIIRMGGFYPKILDSKGAINSLNKRMTILTRENIYNAIETYRKEKKNDGSQPADGVSIRITIEFGDANEIGEMKAFVM